MFFDTISIILIVIFVLTIFLIAFEHQVSINKSWISLFAGTIMWMVLSFHEKPEQLRSAISHEGGQIFELFIFLLGAMTIVELLAHFRFFSWLEYHLTKLHISTKQLFMLLGLITFWGSAILDNLTITLIIIQVGKKVFHDEKNFMVFAANTVIAANAGGAMSPIGDVTTIMLWLAGKFTAWQIFFTGLLPALVCWGIPQLLLARQVSKEEALSSRVREPERPLKWGIVAIALITFGFAVIVNLLSLPPFFGILFGLGTAAIIIDLSLSSGKLKRSEGRVSNLIQKADLGTLIFFTGILLAVGALNHHGVLQKITEITFGKNPTANSLILGHTAVGAVSAIMDNVPLTAAVIKMLPGSIDYSFWVLLAITAGTGGSILVIGSAAGVAAMGQVPALTFVRYFKIATFPAALGYIAAVFTWYIQRLIIGG